MKKVAGRPKGAMVKLLVRTFKRELLAIGFFSAIVNVLMLSPTLYMLQVMDRVMLSRSELTLAVLSAIVLFLYGLQAYSEIVRSRLIIGVGLKFDAMVSDRLFEGEFQRQLSQLGAPSNQSFEDLMLIRQWLTGQAVFAVFDLPWAPIYIGVMYLLHPLLGFLALFFMAILLLFAWWTNRVTRPLIDEAAKEGLELNAFVYSKLRNAEVIEAHGMVKTLFRQWWENQRNHLLSQDRAGKVESYFTISSKEIRGLMQSLALTAGAILAINGEISAASMIAASLLISRATSPIDQIVSGWNGFVNVRSAYSRLAVLFDEGTQRRRPNFSANCHDDATISLENVSAFAPAGTAPILENLNIKFSPGEIHLVLGPSGAGKSTLGRVLAGVWPNLKGTVYFNGVDFNQVDRSSIGQCIGYLPQEIELFSGSVAGNIARLGQPIPSEVIRAAKLTGVHELMLQLPRGYDTEIGELGGLLSGGQRQRLALTRALYGNPKLVILDEPNANLDEGGEIALVEALAGLKERGATIVVISHRISLLDIANRVLMLEAGKLVYDGDARRISDRLRSEVSG